MSSDKQEKYTETSSIDIFSAGCILSAFLMGKPSHPHAFGNQDFEVSENIKLNRPVNLHRLEDLFYRSLISDMIQGEPSKRITADSLEKRLMDKKDMPEIKTEDQKKQKTTYQPIKWTGQITYDKTKLLGKSNSSVYEGTYQSKKYAVKKVLIQVNDKNQQRECENQTILNHENILEFITVEEDEQQNFRFIVLELCAGTLGEMIDKKKPFKFHLSSVSGTMAWMAPEIQKCFDEKKKCTVVFPTPLAIY